MSTGQQCASHPSHRSLQRAPQAQLTACTALPRLTPATHVPSCSEWQTRSIHTYVKSLGRKALWVDVHSGTWSLMTPWGGRFDFSDVPADTVARWQGLLDVMQPPFRSADNAIGISAGLSSGMVRTAQAPVWHCWLAAWPACPACIGGCMQLINAHSHSQLQNVTRGLQMYASQGSADDTAFGDVGFPYVLTVEVFTQPDSFDSGECAAQQREVASRDTCAAACMRRPA